MRHGTKGFEANEWRIDRRGDDLLRVVRRIDAVTGPQDERRRRKRRRRTVGGGGQRQLKGRLLGSAGLPPGSVRRLPRPSRRHSRRAHVHLPRLVDVGAV